MMKSKQWLLALGVVTAMTVSGIAMAATAPEKGEGKLCKPRQEAHQKGEFHKGMKYFQQTHAKLLEILKIDEQTFKTEIKAGKTLLVIANENGVSEKELKRFLTVQMSNHIEQGVKEGRISAERATNMKAHMADRVNNIINGKMPVHHRDGDKRGQGMMADAKLLEILKIDQATLRSELQAGKNLAAIAKDRGVSEQELQEHMIARMTERLDEGVRSGRISAEQAADRKVNIAEMVNNLINGKAPMHPGFQGHGKRHKA